MSWKLVPQPHNESAYAQILLFIHLFLLKFILFIFWHLHIKISASRVLGPHYDVMGMKTDEKDLLLGCMSHDLMNDLR